MSLSLAFPDRVRHLRLDSGRRVGWSEFGVATGTPVLFCTGAGMTGSLGFGADALRELGVRLICVDRAGLGESSPDPDKTFERHARDVASVLQSEGLVQPSVVGFSQGAPFAVALAGAQLVSAVALVSGQDELAHPPTKLRLAPEVAGMVSAIEADRAGFEAAFTPRVDAEGLWSLVLGMSAPEDRARYSEPAFAEAYRHTLARGFAQGPGGYVRDLTLAMSRWPFPPESISVPVSLWYGRLDTSPVHSPDFGATLGARFPRATVNVLPEERGSLLWTRSGDILRRLLEEAGRGEDDAAR